MSSYRPYSFSDNLDTRQPSASSEQQTSIGHEFGEIRELTDWELREAGLRATSAAIRQGWTPDEAPGELADVLGALGVKA